MSFLNKDVLSGALFIVVGLAGLWIGQDYAVGTAFRMGPGYFPRLLCALLVLVGAIVAVKGVIAGGERPDALHWRPLIMMTIALLTFALLIGTVGMLPAAAAVVFLGAAGGPEFRLIEGIVISAVLTAAALAIFKFGLGLTMPIFELPALGIRY